MRGGGELRLADVESSYDAVVVGSGMGGGVLTLKLARAGMNVLLVEKGGLLDLAPPAPGEPIGRYMYGMMTDEARLSFVGGETKFYGAALYRFRESDFAAVEHEAGVSPQWPISYADLEPYYAEAEELLCVHGSPAGDPSEPSRSAPYPHPPLPHDPKVAAIVARLEAAGMQVAAIPRGIDYGPGRPCVLCPTCDVYACRLGAKMDAETAAIRPALATGNVDLLTQAECLGVLTDAAGTRASGVLLRQGGEEKRVLAPVVAVCAGLEQSVLLLRRSRNAAHPEGLGNHAGMLGRGVAGHTTSVMFALVSASEFGARHTKTFAINSYYEGAPDWPYPIGVVQAGGQIPIWEGVSRLKRVPVEIVAKRSLVCFYMNEALPTPRTGYVFEGDAIAGETPPLQNARSFARLRKLAAASFTRAGYPVLPARLKPSLWHKTGGAVMGADPASSVTDTTGQAHGIAGLYVAGAAVLPTAGAVNTGLTIAALALRTGAAIAGARASVAEAASAQA